MEESKSVSLRRGRGCQLVAVILLVLASGLIVRCGVYLFGSLNSPGNYDPTEEPQRDLLDLPVEVVADVQVENHTCGYHALAALYRAWGRDPERSRLRFRLGVDLSAVPGMGSTRGTLHPDLLRVVEQDGFQYRMVDPEAAGSMALIQKELEEGHPVLILEIREETGGLHWVVGDRWVGGKLRLQDSLEEEPTMEEGVDFFENRVLSVLFVGPREEGEEEDLWRAHQEGIEEMKRVQKRLKKVTGNG